MTFRSPWLAAAVAAGSFAAAPAFAQKMPSDLTVAQQDEMYCVYQGIGESDLFYDIGEDYLVSGGVDPDAETGKGLAAIVKGCVDTYTWDQSHADMATALGIVGTASDVLSEDAFLILDDAEFDAMYDAIDLLSDDDIDIMINADWRQDAALQGRAKVALGKAGFPIDDADLVTDALWLMEINIAGLMLTQAWAEDYAE